MSSKSFLDLCLHFSPDVFTQGNRVFIKINSSLQAQELLNASMSAHDNRNPVIRHLQLLHEFAEGTKPFFVCAPTPSLAAWALKQQETPCHAPLKVYSSLQIQKIFHSLHPKYLRSLLSDHEKNCDPAQRRAFEKSWKTFLNDLDYLGIKNTLDLKSLFQESKLRHLFFKKFPTLAPLLYRRLILNSVDFSLTAHKTQNTLHDELKFCDSPTKESQNFYPSEWEILIAAENILKVWQLRLESRKSLLMGLELVLEFQHYQHSFEFYFEEGLKRSSEILPLIQNKLQNLSPDELKLFSLPLLNAELVSTQIESPYRSQLDIFEQKRVSLRPGFQEKPINRLQNKKRKLENALPNDDLRWVS